jgi:hypothetical protein
MAASQARLLMLEARKSDLELMIQYYGLTYLQPEVDSLNAEIAILLVEIYGK